MAGASMATPSNAVASDASPSTSRRWSSTSTIASVPINQTEEQARQGKLPESTDGQRADPSFVALPRYWVDEIEIDACLNDLWDHGWLLGWRDITGSEKMRTVIASVLPRRAWEKFLSDDA